MAPLDPAALQRLIEDSGVLFRKTKQSYVFTCPRCNKKDKLMMFRGGDGRFICWVCAETSNFRGRPEFALTEILGIPVSKIRQELYGELGAKAEVKAFEIHLADFFGEDEEPPADLAAEVKGRPWPLDFYPIDHPHASRGLAYCEGRGISLEIAKKYRLRYCPVQSRVIFPCYVGDKLLGWQARFIHPHEWYDEEEGKMRKVPKILTTGNRDQMLMFQDRLVGQDTVVLCEGPVDAIKCDSLGIGNVCTMGKVISSTHLALVKGSGARRIYIGFDLDAGSESMKLLAHFNGYYDIETGQEYEIYKLEPLEGYEDLGAMPVELMPAALASAQRLSPGQLFLGLGA